MKLLPYLRKTQCNTLAGPGAWAWCGILVALGWYASMWLRNSYLEDWIASLYDYRREILIGTEGDWAYAGTFSLLAFLSCLLLSVMTLYLTLQYRGLLRDLGKAGQGMKKLAAAGVLGGTTLSLIMFFQLNFISTDTIGLWPLLFFSDAFLALFVVKLMGWSRGKLLRVQSLLILSCALRLMIGAGLMLPWVVIKEMGTVHEIGLGQLIFGITGMVWLVIMRSISAKSLMAYMPGLVISALAFALHPPIWMSVALLLGLSLPIGKTGDLGELAKLGEVVRVKLEPWLFVVVAPVLAFIGGGVLIENEQELFWLNPMMVSSLLIGLGVWPVGYVLGCGLITWVMKQRGRVVRSLQIGSLVRVAWWSAAGLAVSPAAMIAISNDTGGMAAVWRFGIGLVCIFSVLIALGSTLVSRVHLRQRRRRLIHQNIDPRDPAFDVGTLSRR